MLNAPRFRKLASGLLSASLLSAPTTLVNALAWHLFLSLAFSHPRVQAAYARRRDAFTRFASAAVAAFGLRLVWATLDELRSGVRGGASPG